MDTEKINAIFKDYMQSGDVFEYYLKGSITPPLNLVRKISYLVLAAVVLLLYLVFNVNVIIAVIVALGGILLMLNLNTHDVYMAKVGKRLFLYEKGLFTKGVVDIVPLKNIEYYVDERYRDGLVIECKIDNEVKAINITGSGKKLEKGEENEDVNQFLKDINAKKKK